MFWIAHIAALAIFPPAIIMTIIIHAACAGSRRAVRREVRRIERKHARA